MNDVYNIHTHYLQDPQNFPPRYKCRVTGHKTPSYLLTHNLNFHKNNQQRRSAEPGVLLTYKVDDSLPGKYIPASSVWLPCCTALSRECTIILDQFQTWEQDHFSLRPPTEARLLAKDGDRGRRGWRLDCGFRPKKTGETVDCRQNNGSVKAVSPRHCAVTSALRNCCFNCRAGQSHKYNVHCTAVKEQSEAKEVQILSRHKQFLF